MTPLEAISLYKLKKITAYRIKQLANEWLDEGFYNEELGELFFIKSPDMYEVGPLFVSAVKKMGIQEPTKLEAANYLLNLTLKRIVNNELSPQKGAEFLYSNIHHEIEDEIPDNEYVGDNLGLEHIFCWLRELWDCQDGSMILYHTDLPREEAEKKFVEHIIEESRKILNKNK
ncbi:hypothetical protein [Candidatus Electrothrix sp.]|uniref:hypothetical protein n=1 Tax=Candidatus Electrothrix sp. TaxID=2170559 RepID=UPI00405742C5